MCLTFKKIILLLGSIFSLTLLSSVRVYADCLEDAKQIQQQMKQYPVNFMGGYCSNGPRYRITGLDSISVSSEDIVSETSHNVITCSTVCTGNDSNGTEVFCQWDEGNWGNTLACVPDPDAD